MESKIPWDISQFCAHEYLKVKAHRKLGPPYSFMKPWALFAALDKALNGL